MQRVHRPGRVGPFAGEPQEQGVCLVPRRPRSVHPLLENGIVHAPRAHVDRRAGALLERILGVFLNRRRRQPQAGEPVHGALRPVLADGAREVIPGVRRFRAVTDPQIAIGAEPLAEAHALDIGSRVVAGARQPHLGARGGQVGGQRLRHIHVVEGGARSARSHPAAVLAAAVRVEKNAAPEKRSARHGDEAWRGPLSLHAR